MTYFFAIVWNGTCYGPELCCISGSVSSFQGSLGGSVVKNLPLVQERQVRSLGGEDPLEREMATHSSSVA